MLRAAVICNRGMRGMVRLAEFSIWFGLFVG